MVIGFGDLLEALSAAPVILAPQSFGHRSDGQVHPGPYPPERRPRQDSQDLSSKATRPPPCAWKCMPTVPRTFPRAWRLWNRTFARRSSAQPIAPRLAPSQAKIWSLREAALGLSMAMKDDAKSLSFVEDTAVPPERLSEYIGRFLEMLREQRHHCRRLRARFCRLPARASRRQHEDRTGRAPVRKDRRERERPGAGIRRSAFRRAWRWPGTQPFHARHVWRHHLRSLSRSEAYG